MIYALYALGGFVVGVLTCALTAFIAIRKYEEAQIKEFYGL